MGVEIEHKYTVTSVAYREMAIRKHSIAQGYLCREPERTVRVRVRDDKGFITIKGKNQSDMRAEFEYEIPVEDARVMLRLCLPYIIEKVRYIVPFSGHIWEIDEFKGGLAPLAIAEIELQSSDEQYQLPPFVGDNVTNDVRYYNSNLSLYGLSQF